MTQLHLQADIGNWVVNLAFWTCLVFPAVTALYWPWWREWWGRNMVVLEMLIAVALTGGILRIDFGLKNISPIMFGWIVLGSVGLIPLVVIHRVWLIWRRQRGQADNYSQEPDHDSSA